MRRMRNTKHQNHCRARQTPVARKFERRREKRRVVSWQRLNVLCVSNFGVSKPHFVSSSKTLPGPQKQMANSVGTKLVLSLYKRPHGFGACKLCQVAKLLVPLIQRRWDSSTLQSDGTWTKRYTYSTPWVHSHGLRGACIRCNLTNNITDLAGSLAQHSRMSCALQNDRSFHKRPGR
jgi:hypothetical protein